MKFFYFDVMTLQQLLTQPALHGQLPPRRDVTVLPDYLDGRPIAILHLSGA